MDWNLAERDLKNDEGVRLRAYPDSLGLLTIGVGHRILSNDSFEYDGVRIPLNTNTVLTKPQALYLCDLDMAKHWDDLLHYLPWVEQLCEPRQRALFNCAFNMGMGRPGGDHGLLSFAQTLAHAERGEWTDVADHLAHSKWDHQVGGRADRVEFMLRTGRDWMEMAAA